MGVQIVGRRHTRLFFEFLLEICTVAETTVFRNAFVAPVRMGLDDPLRLLDTQRRHPLTVLTVLPSEPTRQLILRDTDLRGHTGHIHAALQVAATFNPFFHGMLYPLVGF